MNRRAYYVNVNVSEDDFAQYIAKVRANLAAQSPHVGTAPKSWWERLWARLFGKV